MSKTGWIVMIVITIVVIMVVIFMQVPSGLRSKLISPAVMGEKIEEQVVETSEPVAPKTFKFNSSTDLKKELESINPQVLDSDFE